MVNAGEYGGRVLRGFKGDGTSFIAGAIITPEIANSWPLGNRMALHTQGKVEWFAKPEEDEISTRKSGSPAPARPSRAKVGAESKAPSTRRVRQ